MMTSLTLSKVQCVEEVEIISYMGKSPLTTTQKTIINKYTANKTQILVFSQLRRWNWANLQSSFTRLSSLSINQAPTYPDHPKRFPGDSLIFGRLHNLRLMSSHSGLPIRIFRFLEQISFAATMVNVFLLLYLIPALALGHFLFVLRCCRTQRHFILATCIN